MPKEISLDTIKKAAEALKALSLPELEFLLAYLRVTAPGIAQALSTPSTPAEPVKRGPDHRGRFACSKCGKVLPTKRGRALHESHHEEAPADAR